MISHYGWSWRSPSLDYEDTGIWSGNRNEPLAYLCFDDTHDEEKLEHVTRACGALLSSQSMLQKSASCLYSLWKLLLTIRSAISCLFPAACLHVAVIMACRRSCGAILSASKPGPVVVSLQILAPNHSGAHVMPSDQIHSDMSKVSAPQLCHFTRRPLVDVNLP